MNIHQIDDKHPGNFCSSCGEHLAGNEVFCPRCGRSISHPTATSAVRYRNLGLAVFTVLAALLLLLSGILGKPFYWIAAGFAVLAVLAFVQRKFAAKGRRPAILLFTGGVMLCCFILLFGGSAGGSSLIPNLPQHATVKPSSSDTVVSFGQVRIVIPGGTVTDDETLTLEKKAGLAPPIKDFKPLTPAFDVSLGNLTTFEDPILIEIPYDASKLSNTDPSGAFFAMYYNEDSKLWDAVPCETDVDASVIRLTLYHLTLFQCYFSVWEGQNVYDNETVSVIYLRSGNSANFAKYEEVVGEPSGDVGAPRFVEDVAKYATEILKAYQNLGLKVPNHPKIYVTAEKNNYNSLTGNVSLSLNIANQADPEKEMLRNLAHELFHTAQQATLGTVYYQATKGQNIDFWLEATADYMANTGVWEALKQSPVNKYEFYGIGFFDMSLFSVNGSHEYDAASFVKYMQEQLPASPLQLVNMASSIQPIQKSFLSVYSGKYDSMLGWYEEFMEYSLFDNSSRFLSKTNAKLQESISNRSSLVFELNESGKAKPDAAPIEGSGTLTFKDQYTAGFYVFTANTDTVLTITPGKTVILYVANLNNSGRGYQMRIDAYAGETTEVTLTKDDFLVVAEVSAIAGSTSFTYKALPAIPDLTGTWNCTQFEFVDCEGDDAFWAAVADGMGYDKAGYLAAHNEALQQSGGSYFITFASNDGKAYTVGLGNSMQSQTLTFTDVTVTGSSIVCKAQFNNLWGTLTLTVSGDNKTVTGTFRAQTVYYHGDGTYPAKDIIAVTAVREEPAT